MENDRFKTLEARVREVEHKAPAAMVINAVAKAHTADLNVAALQGEQERIRRWEAEQREHLANLERTIAGLIETNQQLNQRVQVLEAMVIR